jgi:hypothetical protein
MIEDTLAKIEARVLEAGGLPPDKRLELQQLLAELRREAHLLPAQSFAVPEEETAHGTVSRLQESLTEFETTHPQLVGVVNRISNILANMGI